MDVVARCRHVVFGVLVANKHVPGDGSGSNTARVQPSDHGVGGSQTLFVEAFALYVKVKCRDGDAQRQQLLVTGTR